MANLDDSHHAPLEFGHQHETVGLQSFAELIGVGGLGEEFADTFWRIERSHELREHPDHKVADLLLFPRFHGSADDILVGCHGMSVLALMHSCCAL